MAHIADFQQNLNSRFLPSKRGRKTKNVNFHYKDSKDDGVNGVAITKTKHNNNKPKPATRQVDKRKSDYNNGKIKESGKKNENISKLPIIPHQIKTRSKLQDKNGTNKQYHLKNKITSKSTLRHNNKTIDLKSSDFQILTELNVAKDQIKTTNNITSLKRKFKKTDNNIQNESQIDKKRKIVLNNCPNPQIPCLNPCSTSSTHSIQTSNVNSFNQNSSFSNNITDIQQVISEMQSKIKNLEEKSVLDEQKIESFKKVLLEQRNNDIKTLLDEKENELLLRMDLLLLNFDPQRICRLCLLLVDNKECLTSLVAPSENQDLIQLVKNTTNIKVEIDDGLPSGICKECLQQLRNVDWIRRRAQRSNNLINKFVSLKKRNESSSENNLDGKQLLAEIFEVEDDDQDVQNDEFKIQDVFSLENSSNHLIIDVSNLKEEPHFDYETSKISFPVKKSVFHVKHNPRNCKLCKTTFLNPWSLKSHYNYCKKPFQCSECHKCFWNMKLYIIHKRMRYNCGSTKKFRSCQECQVVFRWKWQLVFHVLQHKVYECRFCNEVMYSIDGLKQHVSWTHLASWF